MIQTFHQLFEDPIAVSVGNFTEFVMCAFTIFLEKVVELVSTTCSYPEYLFIALFLFRYVRLVVHIISFWLYKPAPLPASPTIFRRDCTVIIPTVEPSNEDFRECIETVLANEPGAVLVVTVGTKLRAEARAIVADYRRAWPNTKIRVLMTHQANKRLQVCHAIPHVKTPITVLVDDHVFWPSVNFLPTVIAPFEDPKVGVVGTNKRVRRTDKGFGIKAFWNTVGALYLERHNFEIRATNAIDGGVFVISGRTAAHRTRVLQDPAFIPGFTNERFFFGMFGPLNADDDNFITRWYVTNSWKIKIQYNKDACIETTLGTYPKFLSQCLRWARTTWRSNTASLITDRTVWYAQPWCVYAVYITSFTNFALLIDSMLFYLLSQSSFCTTQTLYLLALWIFASKLVKTISFYIRHPSDLIYLPAHILFGYFHSFVKLYAGLTFYNCVWSGRNLNAVEAGAEQADSFSDEEDEGGASNSGTYDGHFDAGDEDTPSFSNHDFHTPPRNPFAKPKNPFATPKATSSRSPPSSSSSSISTPWGSVKAKNLHLRPANVLESSNPLLPRRRSPPRAQHPSTPGGFRSPNPFRSPFPSPSRQLVGASPWDDAAELEWKADSIRRRSRPDSFKKVWERSNQCGRLHADGTFLGRQGECEAKSVWNY